MGRNRYVDAAWPSGQDGKCYYKGCPAGQVITLGQKVRGYRGAHGATRFAWAHTWCSLTRLNEWIKQNKPGGRLVCVDPTLKGELITVSHAQKRQELDDMVEGVKDVMRQLNQPAKKKERPIDNGSYIFEPQRRSCGCWDNFDHEVDCPIMNPRFHERLRAQDEPVDEEFNEFTWPTTLEPVVVWRRGKRTTLWVTPETTDEA